MTPAVWFNRLLPLLKEQKLPCEFGPARIVDVDEFMYMGSDPLGCVTASFKHRDTRNYVMVRKNSTSEPFKLPGEWELFVPVTMVPFNRGFFDKF